MTLDWYYGPTEWDPDPGHAWHEDCPDTVRAGHDGEVWFWSNGTASCQGCPAFSTPEETK